MAKSVGKALHTLNTQDRLNVAAARGMGDAVRSHLCALDYKLSRAEMDGIHEIWEAIQKDYAVLVEALARMEIAS